MDPELLSLFPSETEPPVEREPPRAAVVSSGTGRKPRLRPPTDTMHVLDQHVQFLKARSHAHALSEGYSHARVVNADEATTSAEWSAARSRLNQIRVRDTALIAITVLAALAGAQFLPAVAHTPVQRAELLPTLTARTFEMTEPAVAQRISPREIDRTAQATSINASTLRMKFKGHLVVDSVPAGATVLINQRPAGTTPLNLTDYPAGSYAVWVEREGYERWTAGVRVQADTTTHIRPLLSPKPDQQGADTE